MVNFGKLKPSKPGRFRKTPVKRAAKIMKAALKKAAKSVPKSEDWENKASPFSKVIRKTRILNLSSYLKEAFEDKLSETVDVEPFVDEAKQKYKEKKGKEVDFDCPFPDWNITYEDILNGIDLYTALSKSKAKRVKVEGARGGVEEVGWVYQLPARRETYAEFYGFSRAHSTNKGEYYSLKREYESLKNGVGLTDDEKERRDELKEELDSFWKTRYDPEKEAKGRLMIIDTEELDTQDRRDALKEKLDSFWLRATNFNRVIPTTVMCTGGHLEPYARNDAERQRRKLEMAGWFTGKFNARYDRRSDIARRRVVSDMGYLDASDMEDWEKEAVDKGVKKSKNTRRVENAAAGVVIAGTAVPGGVIAYGTDEISEAQTIKGNAIEDRDAARQEMSELQQENAELEQRMDECQDNIDANREDLNELTNNGEYDRQYFVDTNQTDCVEEYDTYTGNISGNQTQYNQYNQTYTNNTADIGGLNGTLPGYNQTISEQDATIDAWQGFIKNIKPVAAVCFALTLTAIGGKIAAYAQRHRTDKYVENMKCGPVSHWDAYDPATGSDDLFRSCYLLDATVTDA